MNIKFYDTSSLLLAGEHLFEIGEKFLISSITLKELEQIKTANNKDLNTKYNARMLLHLLHNHQEQYEIVVYSHNHLPNKIKDNFDITNDMKILSDAIWYKNAYINDTVTFVTNDLALYHIALIFFSPYLVESVKEEQDSYTGYKEIYADDQLLEAFYQDINSNHFNLKTGEYLILKNKNNEVIDIRVWTGKTHRFLTDKSFNSKWFGKISPYKNDIYQKLLFDSLSNNQITMVKGPAGSGKSLVSLGFLMSQLEIGKIDKIIVFCNTVATLNSAKLGFYPGTKNDKLLDSQIGNLLISKFGGREGVERLINEEKIVLLPMSDIRGYDTTGMRAGVYISEAQNLDRTLIKLALQRIGEDSICIIDGDVHSQVDAPQFEGVNNGMRRVSKVYRGKDIYGEVELKNVHRSKIAEIAEDI